MRSSSVVGHHTRKILGMTTCSSQRIMLCSAYGDAYARSRISGAPACVTDGHACGLLALHQLGIGQYGDALQLAESGVKRMETTMRLEGSIVLNLRARIWDCPWACSQARLKKIGETCGFRLICDVDYRDQPCKLCQGLAIKQRKAAKMQVDIAR